jgi:general secretion pathway protein G
MSEGKRQQAWKSSRCKFEGGYTLLEMLVVIAILGMIVAFATPQVLGYLERSKTKAAQIQITSIAAALDLYRLDAGSYPNEEQGLTALLARPKDAKNWHGPYLTRDDGIIDPWGKPYLYRPPTPDKMFVIETLGADGKRGGEDENEDVSSKH